MQKLWWILLHVYWTKRKNVNIDLLCGLFSTLKSFILSFLRNLHKNFMRQLLSHRVLYFFQIYFMPHFESKNVKYSNELLLTVENEWICILRLFIYIITKKWKSHLDVLYRTIACSFLYKYIFIVICLPMLISYNNK